MLMRLLRSMLVQVIMGVAMAVFVAMTFGGPMCLVKGRAGIGRGTGFSPVHRKAGFGECIIFAEGIGVAVAMTAAIGAALGFESSVHLIDDPAQLADQIGQHVVAGKYQPRRAELDRYVPVAEMVGNPLQHGRVGMRDFEHRFMLGFDAHQPAVGGDQNILVAQHCAMR